MKRFFCLLLCVMLFAAFFAGCDSSDKPENTEEPSVTETATEEPTETPVEGYNEKNDPKMFQDELPRVTGSVNTHVTITPNNGTGIDMYEPIPGNWGYAYAPSIIYYPDGSVDAWFAETGTFGEMDWITYKHSDDGGKTWSDEKVVLRPTPDSYDMLSVCDPGVIYFGGYYYLGYTSTIDSTSAGINNNVFVARSKNPDGPFEKWNGSGWGGDPMPVIYFDEANSNWGAGEPTFVVLDGKIYIYYTWMASASYVYVSVGDATDENWPATLEFKGRAFTNNTGDQVDAVYIEDIGKFIMVQVANRWTEKSGIQIWESTDGIHFLKGEFTSHDIAKYCHNMGIAKRPNGHIQLKDNTAIGYAYAEDDKDSECWGRWPTRFVTVDITTYEGNVDKTDKGNENVLITDYYTEYPDDPQPVGISVYPGVAKLHVGESYTLSCYWHDVLILKAYEIEDTDSIIFSDYDESVIKFEGTKIIGLKAGKTEVTATYKGVYTIFKVYIYEKDFDYNASNPSITSVKAAEPEITIYLGKVNGYTHDVYIRAYVEYSNDTWEEAYVGKFSGYDEQVLKVSKSGKLTAKSVGDTTVTVDYYGKTFTVLVHVAEAPDEFNWTEADFK